MIRLVLADDHKLFREGLRLLLQDQPDFEIVGVAADGLETIQVINESKPDVLLLDISMPGLNGLDVARHVSQRLPQIRVIILSMHVNKKYALTGLRNGISGYVVKDADPEELVQAIHHVMAGKRYFSAPLSESMLIDYFARTHGALDPYETLSNREREVLTLMVEGCNVPQIAERLSINRRTVESHRNNMLRKLGLKTHTDLIRFALTNRPHPP